MKHITSNDLINMQTRFRAQLINSLSGFKSANLIGTTNNLEQTNLAMFSSVFHIGASPALVGFIVRPHTTPRHTLENIQQTKHYTINQVSNHIWPAAHQTSARYTRKQCEFQQTGLNKQFIADICAPFVKESPLKYALMLKEILPLTVNNTLLVIGEVTDIFCQKDIIHNDGYIDIEALGTVAISGLDSYHETQRLSRLSYAKPEQKLQYF
ncbi:flavin reductase family protein [Litorilituus sediminis]|uniref:Flavin reductase n=1 Tax=Litorilituus sediminis TaxID=718192 RepID=A0A4P6P4H9_9GAMM|nr:flavin reductase [Litorilituus sediminis]QBG35848.1 flavin reductase [Litorilituus sediminis]